MVFKLLTYIFYGLYRLLGFTYQYKFENPKLLEDAKQNSPNGSYVIATWHQNVFSGMIAQTGTQHCMLVSRSQDGEIVAKACQLLGHLPLRGSSRNDGRDKGGTQARDAMVETIKRGIPGAITIDGPKGPIYKVKPGILTVAQKTGVPIIPYFTIGSSYWVVKKSWDRLRIPKPFSSVHIFYGEPIYVKENLSSQDFTSNIELVEQKMHELENKAKEQFNVTEF